MNDIFRINNDEKYRYRRNELLKSFIDKFYQENLNKPNIVSRQKIHDDITGWKSLLKKSFWNKRYPSSTKIIFALKSGIVFSEWQIFFITGKEEFDFWSVGSLSFPIELEFENNIIKNTKNQEIMISTVEDVLVLKEYINVFNKFNESFSFEISQEEKNKENQISQVKSSLIKEIDKNNDGKVDLIDNDFDKLIIKNQKQIIEIDKKYIHQFVKVSNYIKIKNKNIQKIFETICNTKDEDDLQEKINLLKNQIYTYDLIVFHSINMVCSLLNEDLISFYEIYETFDKLGIYNSNWENEVSEKLINIGDKLDNLMISINNMENNIVSTISNLTYVTQTSFAELNQSVVKQLKSVESSINFNNLLATLQTYQLYKINLNTKK